MGLLDKIKSGLKEKPNAPTIVVQEEAPILESIDDEDIVTPDNDYLFPFESKEELKQKATEVKEFFYSIDIPDKRTIFGKSCTIQNPRDFILSSIKLMATYWNDQLYVKDRLCDLLTLKKFIENERIPTTSKNYPKT